MSTLGIRGSNPIWSLVDLAGKQFDDTYWMWVLQNQIPYAPETIYEDANLSIPLSNPVQFLGNGTLPIDKFFAPGLVYRLEFRQHIGLGVPTQEDPLIYLVEDYVPESSGTSPIDTATFATENQITNPQFALINFNSPYTFSGTDPDPINIAPGWFLELAGTGTVTLTQVPLNNTNPNPSNAPYALEISLTGWTEDSVFLRQRFQQNGMLWANKIVSTAITARVQGLNVNISATLVDSNDSTLGQILPPQLINNSFVEYTGHAQLGASTNPDVPPAAYIDYKLSLPSNAVVYVTSIQIIVEDEPVEPSFTQDSINRQTDHTYNTAYPIVPVGTVIDYFGFKSSVDHYLDCLGTEISRTQYALLFDALTNVETVTLTSGLTTFTVASGLIYSIGLPLEGTGIQAGSVIANIVGNVITMNLAAIANGAHPITFFSTNNGNGSTTFNTPMLSGNVLAGAFGNLLPSSGVGSSGGSDKVTLIEANLPPHQHVYAFPGSTFLGGGGSTLINANGDINRLTGVGGGTSTPFSIVQPTKLARKLIRFE
jgi:hypothetical protein